MLKEKTCFLFKWISLKMLGQSFNPKFLYPIIESDEGLWEINQSFVSGLTSFELYLGIHRFINFKVPPQDFFGLLDELMHLSGGRQLVLDPAVLESYLQELVEPTTDRNPFYYKSDFSQSPYAVQPTDLTNPHPGLQEEDNSHTTHQLNLLWLASHIALIETILRIYLSNIITSTKLLSAISTITGCPLDEYSIKGLQGADGALFWLVSVAARTATILGINDCTEWLTSHLFDKKKLNDAESPVSSNNAMYTANTDSLKESADKFLRGLAMANLVALTFHFYCPELAPFDDFFFNFPSTGEMEAVASHHNARAVALICQKNVDLYNVLNLMPDSCNGNEIQLSDSGSTTLNTLNLLGFCSQGLARSPTHRRLQHAALAGELFVYFTSRVPNREIPSLIPLDVDSTNYPHEIVAEQFQDSIKRELIGSNCVTSDINDNEVINMIPLDQLNSDSNSVSGQGTYRLDETSTEHQRERQQQPRQSGKTTSYFIRSKTIRLNKNSLDVEKLNSKLNELSTKQLVNSKTGGIYFPDNIYNEENKQDDVENQNTSRSILTKWNPLEALFKHNVINEPYEIFNNIPSTENHVAETECIGHCNPEVMSYCPVPDYQVPITTHGNVFNLKCTNDESVNVTTVTKSQRLKGNPVGDDTHKDYSSQVLNIKPVKHGRSLSHNRMLPIHSSFQHKSRRYTNFYPSRRSCYQIYHTSNHKTDQHDKNNRFVDCHYRSLRKRNFTPNNVDGYSDSDLNTVYYRVGDGEYSSTDYSSSSEQSMDDTTENPNEILYPNNSNQKRHDRHPNLVGNENSRRVLIQNITRKSYRRGRSKRRQRNTSEIINQPYFYGTVPVQHQVCCVHPCEAVSPKDYADIHCLPYTPVQPTYIHSPFIANTLNPNSLYTTNQPRFIGSPTFPVISPLYNTNPLSFSYPNNTDQLSAFNSNEQNILVSESINHTAHIMAEPVMTNQSTNLTTENCSPVTSQNQPEYSSCSVLQHKATSNQHTTISTNSSVIQLPVYYSQAESFFIPFETNSSNVSSTFHHKNKLMSKYLINKSKNELSIDQKPVHNNFTSDSAVHNLDDVSLKPVSSLISITKLENHQLSDSNKITSSSDSTEQLQNNIHAISGGQYPDNNCELHKPEKQTQEHTRLRRDSILPAYLEKRSMKAHEKEINNSDNSRSSSGKSQIISKINDNSLKSTENSVNISKVVIPNQQRRTASVSRTIGVVKPHFNGGRRRYTQDELSLLNIDSQSNTIEDGSSNDLKLFVQLKTKSNRRAISNALNYCCLAGPVNETAKRTALEALGCSDGKHFMILLKSQCQYSGLYNYLPVVEKAIRISGTGPSKIENNMVDKYYKLV
ncbi:Patronin isoform 2 [Schistosoma japonicum]|uniref:Patronin isoform 2 n=2 Tax=Schistosoma japonicum TaxID=6182 RepID=A0A4Z2D5V4_SCHJA|nr:Patronin isoform 2 [Schistosoma japonicum]